jgi:hypothetical protein
MRIAEVSSPKRTSRRRYKITEGGNKNLEHNQVYYTDGARTLFM